ncbi:hypothetical protein [Sphingomonas panaciterrae]|uniref:hypothetical protein n=1 Tax=Sphingomonas panaciterrae TaxID=1462999 RepID=UPI002FF2B5C7
MTILIALNTLAWFGADLLLSGSVVRLFASRARPNDDVLAALSLISALIGLFFMRRLVAASDDATFDVLCILALCLVVYVYRLRWGRGNER